MNPTKQNREALAARIRALLAKTTENGCTEAEALAAAQKAGELMDKHGLTMTAVEMKEEGCLAGGVRAGTAKVHEVWHAAYGISRFCGVKCWLNTAWSPREKTIVYFGLKSDVQVACYLTRLIVTAMESEFKAYLKSDRRPTYVNGPYGYLKPANGRTLRADFMRGMAHRISIRLQVMRREREGAVKMSDGRALVVVKDAVVEAAFAATGEKIGSARHDKWGRARTRAYGDGQLAGERVALNPGIGRESAAARLR